jgi:hypothetical protein
LIRLFITTPIISSTTKPGIIVDAEGTCANRVREIAVTKTMPHIRASLKPKPVCPLCARQRTEVGHRWFK